MPNEKIYLPLQVGFKSDISGFLRDNTGDNIALKNPYYSELTGQYWAWKNRKADIKGIVHYRRYFTDNVNPYGSVDKKYSKILKEKTIKKLLDRHEIILPKKRNYFIETLWTHYEHARISIEPLLVTKEVIHKKFPDYAELFDKVMNRRKAHMFNMFIARENIFDEYSAWLFKVLFEVEKNIDLSNYSGNEARVYGWISEFLMDVWVEKNKISYVEMPVTFIEGQNYLKKGIGMIQKKIKG